MNALLNQHLIADTTVDSAALGVHGCVVHRLADRGAYQGSVYLGDRRIVGNFRLIVDEEGPAQTNVDLASFTSHASTPKQERFVVGTDGYVVFYVSWGRPGYSVRLAAEKRDTKVRRFDSRVLGPGDVFAVTLIRPGRYRVTNEETGARGRITVAYPPIRAVPYEPPQPVAVECGGKTIRPSEIGVRATQGQVYRCLGPSRIVIELTKPDDGARKSQGTRTRRKA